MNGLESIVAVRAVPSDAHWPKETRDLRRYLGREWNFTAVGRGNLCKFCTSNGWMMESRPRSAKANNPPGTRPPIRARASAFWLSILRWLKT